MAFFEGSSMITSSYKPFWRIFGAYPLGVSRTQEQRCALFRITAFVNAEKTGQIPCLPPPPWVITTRTVRHDGQKAMAAGGQAWPEPNADIAT